MAHLYTAFPTETWPIHCTVSGPPLTWSWHSRWHGNQGVGPIRRAPKPKFYKLSADYLLIWLCSKTQFLMELNMRPWEKRMLEIIAQLNQYLQSIISQRSASHGTFVAAPFVGRVYRYGQLCVYWGMLTICFCYCCCSCRCCRCYFYYRKRSSRMWQVRAHTISKRVSSIVGNSLSSSKMLRKKSCISKKGHQTIWIKIPV